MAGISMLKVGATGILSWGAILCSVGHAFCAPYLLGPEDKLQIRVYEWRPNNGQAFEWAPLNGKFTVSASGNLSLPMVGEIPVQGVTTADVADTIATRLQSRIGLSKRPDASVEVTEYRPFYISGFVSKAGQFPYQPDLTVMKAVSLAGGLYRPTENSAIALEREAVTSRGDLRSLNAEYINLVARRMRLEAEIQDKPSVDPGKDLSSFGAKTVVDRAIREEQLLLDERRRFLQTKEDGLKQTKALIAKEVDNLKSKGVSMQRQLDLATEELDAVSSLVAKGLSVTSRRIALDQNVAQFKTSLLDVELAGLRAQQDIAKTDREIQASRNDLRNEALKELNEVRSKIAVNTERRATASALIDNTEVASLQTNNLDPSQESETKIVYRITRGTGGDKAVITAQETDTVEPGDVLQVILKKNPNGQSSSVLSSNDVFKKQP
ncbi:MULTISPECIES: polysaccharide biosynthesis/export family protein [unclassified Methylobacterium]|uniref:polysaccharide biosynthesis/export family protein n=1 Tax=unclassified Methylobacterium TaxID=2615210 RepID=UPI002269B980|nr:MULTISPECIES: polysaccharide biosynthesis/export family protein [unclassified Methylobacterium]